MKTIKHFYRLKIPYLLQILKTNNKIRIYNCKICYVQMILLFKDKTKVLKATSMEVVEHY